jgi:hypothetical protein
MRNGCYRCGWRPARKYYHYTKPTRRAVLEAFEGLIEDEALKHWEPETT